MMLREQFAWSEKYRPQSLADCILPASVASSLQGIVSQGNMPNLLFTGKPGVGKTTSAKAICRDIGADVLVINASNENGIAVLRDKITDFASSMSFGGSRKFVILDEADYLNAQSTQPALRAFIDESALNCGFIFCVNYPDRIIDPLKSRCSIVDFKIPAAEKKDVLKGLFKRCTDILTAENVTFDKAIVAGVVQMYYPDFRRVLNELQRYSSTGALSEAVLSQLADKDIVELFTALKSKDFTTVRKWVGNHEDLDLSTFYHMMMEQVLTRIDESSRAQIIVILADYSYRASFAVDKVLNQLACLVEIMHEAKFK